MPRTRKSGRGVGPRVSALLHEPAGTGFPESKPGSAKSAESMTETSTPPYSSDGPTLPIIGGLVGGLPTPVMDPQNGGDGEAGKKRRRTDDGSGAPSFVDGKGTAVANTTAPARTGLAPLYQPWILLPAPLRAALGTRLQNFETNVVPVVYTKNQNIKSAVNKLSKYLTTGASMTNPSSTQGRQELPNSPKKIVAVSAQGDATTKLAGVIEMIKRILKPAVDQDGSVDIQDWYIYTSLASRTVEKQANTKKTGKESAAEVTDEEEIAFESLAAISDKDQEARSSNKTVAVLTVWLSRTAMREFKDAFGEEKIQVATKKEEA